MTGVLRGVAKRVSGDWRAVLFLIGVALIPACAVKLVYNQLDWLVPWYVSDYLDLNGKQDDFFEERLEDYLDWHRKSQLPEYSAFLDKVATDVADGLSEQEVRYLQNETERLAGIMMERLAPDIADLFADADDQQLTDLYVLLEKEGDRLRAKNAGASLRKLQEEQVEEVIDTIERWTGSLSDAQEDMVATWGGRYQPMGEDFYQAGTAWRAEFKGVLALRKQPKLYRSRLITLLTTPNFGRSETLEQKLESNKNALTQLYFELDRSFTKKQRRHIVSTLHSYAEDFAQLSKEDG
ncbi:hypothetical protein A9Q99_06645 [Gammaproteobacteria bacterium 45_16_T64]|nr:hypothetical protein A9Q99_06645 [Gammaproteobacteria bacterium 45_16_T64]